MKLGEGHFMKKEQEIINTANEDQKNQEKCKSKIIT